MSTEKLATKSDLQEMYSRIRPYLGGSADAGFTPIGTIISVMGNSAPANYLVCNGQTVNIADYPELANYFLQQFGSKNKFGGDGTTTFGIPDLRGEFLRGTGSNGHSGQGNGAAVGTHQDGTEHNIIRPYSGSDSSKAKFVAEIDTKTTNNYVNNSKQSDTSVTHGSKRYAIATAEFTISEYTTNGPDRYMSRPTNTSVLFCIATKNIYLNPSMDYSTDEKVVGTWIDGKTIYQKTISCGALPNATAITINHGISGIDKVIGYEGISIDSSNNFMPLPYANFIASQSVAIFANRTSIIIGTGYDWTAFTTTYVTLRYTKTS